MIEPDSGYLACGMVGAGRLADPEHIVAATLERLGISQDLAGETVLITAGPTHEPIDPVRYLGNRSSGKMGYALAEAALRRGAKLVLVSGPVALVPPSAAETVFVETAQQMRSAVLDRWEQADIIIMAAAVADYHVKRVASEKIKRNGPMSLELEPNPRHPCRPGQLASCRGQEHAGVGRLCGRNGKSAGERAREANEEACGHDCAQRCFARRNWLQLRPQRSHHRHRKRGGRGCRGEQAGNCTENSGCRGSQPAGKGYTGDFTGL